MSRITVTVDAIDRNDDDVQVATLVADNGVSVIVPVSALPDGTEEGVVLTLALDVDPDETERRRMHVKDLQKKLFG